MTNRDIRTVWHALQLPVDLVSVWAGFFLAYLTRKTHSSFLGYELIQGYIPPETEFFRQIVIMSLVLILVFTFQGLYHVKFRRPFIREIPHIVWSVLLWTMIILAYFFLIRSFYFSRFVLLFGAFLTLFIIILARAALRALNRLFLYYGIGRINLLFIGENTVTEKLNTYLKKNKYYHIVGRKKLSDLNQEKLKEVINREQIDEIIYTDSIRDIEEINNLLFICRNKQVAFRFVPEVVQIHSKNIAAEHIGDFPVIELKPTKLDGWGKIFKRAFDSVVAGIALTVLLIPFLIIGIIIKIDTRGPVFVKLTRINRGRPFTMLKFRSMVEDAQEQKKKLMKYNERGDGPLFKMKNDPRITKVGRILRKTRLDELPQLINVLAGTMSLVGPRPHEPEEVAKYEKHHQKVLTIKPGLTGLSQVHGASDLPFEEEVKIDTFYIENWSLWLDIEIIFRTIWVVIRGKGAA